MDDENFWSYFNDGLSKWYRKVYNVALNQGWFQQLNEVTESETTASQLSAAIKTIADRGQTDLQIFTDGSTVEGTSNGGAGLVVIAGESIIHRWHAATGVHSSSFQVEKTAMEKAISWLEKNDDWREALLIYEIASRSLTPLVTLMHRTKA